MKAFMQSQELSFIPEFIQEVANSKSFVRGYQNSGTTRLIGLGEMHLFKFYVDSDGVPVMKYKKLAVDLEWLPIDKGPLCLFNKDIHDHPMLPRGSPKPFLFKPMWGSKDPKETGNQEKAMEIAHKATLNKGFIFVGLEKYIQYWSNGMSKCDGFANALGPYVDYWNRLLHELKKPLLDCLLELLEGFWTHRDWKVQRQEMQDLPLLLNPMDVEDKDPELYCGPANKAPQKRFNPWLDIRPGSWVLLRPADPNVCLVWQGQTLSNVCRVEGNENNGKFLLQYWRPDNFEATLELQYRNCWYGKWVVENSPPMWVDANCVVYSTWSKIVDPKSRTIPKKNREASLSNLNRARDVDPGFEYSDCFARKGLLSIN